MVQIEVKIETTEKIIMILSKEEKYLFMEILSHNISVPELIFSKQKEKDKLKELMNSIRNQITYND